MNDSPKVSIAIPVYNGENYIRLAIESFLAQTFTDFELILADNCSTDSTWAICEAYAAKDKRIRLHKQAKNIGANGNFNSTVALAKGKYFKWAAHDDLVAPTYLEKCVQALENDPQVVLANSYTALIDKNGNPFAEIPESGRLIDEDGGVVFLGTESPERKLDSPHIHERFYAILFETNWVYDIFGLIRTDILRGIPLLEDYYTTDNRILADLVMRGTFAIIPEDLFFNRRHAKQSASQISIKEKAAWSNPFAKNSALRYRWLRLRGYLRVIFTSPIRFGERMACFGVLLRYYLRLRRLQLMFEQITGIHDRRIQQEVSEKLKVKS